VRVRRIAVMSGAERGTALLLGVMAERVERELLRRPSRVEFQWARVDPLTSSTSTGYTRRGGRSKRRSGANLAHIARSA
jgi:hypothetical protein